MLLKIYAKHNGLSPVLRQPMKRQPPDVCLYIGLYDWRHKAQKTSSSEWELEKQIAKDLLDLLKENEGVARGELVLQRQGAEGSRTEEVEGLLKRLQPLTHEEVVAWLTDKATSSKPRQQALVRGSRRLYSPKEVQEWCLELRHRGWTSRSIGSLLSLKALGTKPLGDYQQIAKTQVDKVFHKLQVASGIKKQWQGRYSYRNEQQEPI